jgi:hypothetical protein
VLTQQNPTSTSDFADENARVLPFETERIVDLVMRFVDIYNASAKIRLYAYQRVFMRRIIQSILDRDGTCITGLWARQSGKSEAIACLASGLCIFLPTLARAFPDDPRLSQFQEGFKIGIYAPSQEKSALIYERVRTRARKKESLELYKDPDLNLTVEQSNGERVTWSNGSYVLAKTASESTNAEGHTFHLIIVDEAQYVSSTKVMKELQPMLTATAGTMVKIGTAHISYGGFRNSIIHNIEREKAGGSRNHFEFPYDRIIAEKKAAYEAEARERSAFVAKRKALAKTGTPQQIAELDAQAPPVPADFHQNYEKSVAEFLEQIGGNIENDEFAMNYRLLWKDANTGAVDRTAFLEAGDDTREANVSSWRFRQVAGLDFGKKKDSTVLTLYEIDPLPVTPHALLRSEDDEAPSYSNKRVIAWLEQQGRWKDQLNNIVDFLADFNVDTLVADATAVGDPLTEQLADLLPGINVIPFVFTTKGKDQIYKLYLNEMEAGRIEYPAGPETQNTQEYQQYVFQHLSLVKEHKGAYMTCRAAEGEHDDYPDSAALGCLAATFDAEAEVEVSVNPLYAGNAGSRNRGYSRSERYR